MGYFQFLSEPKNAMIVAVVIVIVLVLTFTHEADVEAVAGMPVQYGLYLAGAVGLVALFVNCNKETSDFETIDY